MVNAAQSTSNPLSRVNESDYSEPELQLLQLKAFLKSQETRVALYHEFDEAFGNFSKGEIEEQEYKTVVKLVTEGFQVVSNEIISYREKLNSLNSTELAEPLGTIQNLERQKLKHTIDYQSLKIQDPTLARDITSDLESLNESRQNTEDRIQDELEQVRVAVADLHELVADQSGRTDS